MPFPRALLPVLALCGVLAGAASAQVVLVDDDFDDGVLDPAWNVTLTAASGWTFREAGSRLTVNDITPDPSNTGSNAQWAVATLARPIPPLGDFELDWDFAWDSAGTRQAMHYVYVRLLRRGASSVLTGMNDSWFDWSGSAIACAGGACRQPGFNSLPLAGQDRVRVTRRGETLTIERGGSVFFTGTDGTAFDEISIAFAYYPVGRGATLPTFGSLSLDRIRLTTGLATNGTACPGSLGAPMISSAIPPTAGGTASISVRNVPAAGIPPGLLVGVVDSQPAPLDGIGMPGCSLYVAPVALTLVGSQPSNGYSFADLAMPPGVNGFPMYFQWAVLDPGTNALGVLASERGSAVVR